MNPADFADDEDEPYQPLSIEADATSLRRRLMAWEEHGDPSGILDPEAIVETVRLWDQTRIFEPMQITFAVPAGRLHWHRFLLLDEPDDEQDAISAEFLTKFVRERTPHLLPELVAPLVQAAWKTDAAAHPDRGAKIAGAILEQELADDPRMLDRVITLLRPAAEVAVDYPARTARASDNLAGALHTRSQRLGDPADLDEAIEAGRRAVTVAEASDTNRPAFLGNHCGRLCVRFQRNGDLEDIDEAITAGTTAVGLLAQDHPWRAGIETNLANAQRLWEILVEQTVSANLDIDDLATDGWAALYGVMESDDPYGLDKAVLALRLVARTAAPSAQLDALDLLALALAVRYERQGQPSDLDEALATFARAFTLATPSDVNKMRRLHHYANTLYLRYQTTIQSGDLDQVIRLFREITDLDPGNAAAWSNLGNALLNRYQLTESDGDLDAAIASGRRSLDLESDTGTPVGDPIQLSALSDALYARFRRDREESDLQDALTLARRAVQTSPIPKHRLVDSLSAMLFRRFEEHGAIGDLDEVIALTRATTRGRNPRMAADLGQLSEFLRIRYEFTGARQDLDEAIELGERALQRLRADSLDHGIALVSLCNTYRLRSLRDGTDHERELALGRAAVSELAGSPLQDIAMASLANTLAQNHADSAQIKDLDEAIDLMRQASGISPEEIGRKSDLSVYLRTRFESTGNIADLDEAVRLGRAVIAPEAADRDLSRRCWTLGIILRTRFVHTADHQDAQEAIALWRNVARDLSAPTRIRIYAARDLARIATALQDHVTALAGYEEALQLLQALAWRGLDRLSAEEALASVSGLASEAAASALEAGLTDRAVELLEQGRSVIWSQLLDTRGDLDALRQKAPDLARELMAVRTALDAVDNPVTADITTAMTGGIPTISQVPPRLTDLTERVALASRWNDLVAQVRRRPGLSGFLRPRGLPELLPPPGSGPVVIVNVSASRCDALIVDDTQVRSIRLENLSAKELSRVTVRYVSALWDHEQQRSAKTRLRMETAVTETLGWLWDTIASPVLSSLGHDPIDPAAADGADWPRIWWYPTSTLQMLPLSAAGRHDEPGQSVLDRVVSSTTPTLRALAEARSAPAAGPDRPTLVVAMPETAGRPALALPEVRRELEHITSLLPPERLIVMEDTAATRARVYRALGECAAVHFGCHGHMDWHQPSKSGVVLDDGTLTVTDIVATGGRGDLAVLSACRTASSGLANPDEVVHIAAALHYTGWRHVVATLSSVDDRIAADVTCELYSRLVREGGLETADTARVVHDIVRGLRLRNVGRPSAWAPFVHFGP